MNLGQVKAALAKFPADMDSAECFFVYAVNGQRQLDITCAVGIIPIEDTAHIAIVTKSEIDRIQAQTGALPPLNERIPPGPPPTVEGDEWKNEG